jgi:hypothetical protein
MPTKYCPECGARRDVEEMARQRIFSQRERVGRGGTAGSYRKAPKPKRKLSDWNKFVRANSNKPRFRYRNGKLNLKKMGVAFRKTPRYRKNQRLRPGLKKRR